MSSLVIHSLACAALSVSLLFSGAVHATAVPEQGYLFSYFTGNGEDGLHLAWSRDGLKWVALNDGKSFLQPKVGKSKLMRDPCVLRGPDGTFHMVWTDSWDSQTIGYASSKDLIHWSEQKAIPVMKDEPTVKNCWAPEVVYDKDRECFVIFWASTIPGRFPETWFDGKNDNNHRIYATTTKDFETFTPTKLFFNPGFNCIDSTLLQKDGKVYMIFKDETKYPSPMKNLRLAVADTVAGPYQVRPEPINPPNSWVEGPTALQIGDMTYLYFDAYTRHHYAALRSRDLKHWEDITLQISFPRGTRHGTAFAVEGAVVERLMKVNAHSTAEFTPKAILNVMERVADWQLANPSQHRTTDWTQGACYAGMMALADVSKRPKYHLAMLAMGHNNEWKLGPRKYHADDHAVGQTYAELYLQDKDPRMIEPMREQFDSILANPREFPSLDFTQQGIGDLWSWCDSLFMAPPTWMRLYAATGDKRYRDFAVSNWWRTSDYLYDTNEHLYFRDSTYFDKREANGKKIFWSRGNGWVMAGLVRVLQYLPKDDPARARFETQFKEMAGAILKCQQDDGLWRSSLLDPEEYPLKETSGSGFYTYALAWGVNQGLLDRAVFEPAVRKAWSALVGCVEPDGKLTHVQPIGADPRRFDENATEVYGVGAFLLAGSELYRMAEGEAAAK